MPYPGRDGNIDHILNEHVHSPGLVAPNLATYITVTDGVGAWALGNASATILDGTGIVYDIHWIDITAISTNAEYQLNLYCSTYTGGVNPICEVSFSRTATSSDAYVRIPVMTPILTGGLITAKLASSTGSETCGVKIGYHTY